jgi:NADH dehydrogenase
MEMTMSEDRNIVIVGGGFAGTTAATALERRLPAGHRVILISEESYTTFNPMLAEVVGASVFPEHVVAPIRQMLDPSRGRHTGRSA